MNRIELDRIMRSTFELTDLLSRHGRWLLEASQDWQSPLRSGGGPGPKGDHSDPTYSTMVNPDPLALVHTQFTEMLIAHHKTATALDALVRKHVPLTEAQTDKARNRVNSDPGCVACGGPAPAGHRRAGKCDACRKAWERAGKPDLTTFRRIRAKEAEAASIRLHDHEVTG